MCCLGCFIFTEAEYICLLLLYFTVPCNLFASQMHYPHYVAEVGGRKGLKDSLTEALWSDDEKV